MSDAPTQPAIAPDQPVTVLLVDDQAIIGEAVGRMLRGEEDIHFHFCREPARAVAMAESLAPTVILQDLMMPDVDGLTLVKFFRANPNTRDIPLIVLSGKEEPKVKADAFALGANDYLVKLPDRVELIARIRYHSGAYNNFLQRKKAYQALEESQRRLAAELAEAAAYVESLLPGKMEGTLSTDWIFIPSTQLGGDALGYHWLDGRHASIYLLDVSGHGVGAALLSVSVVNALRSLTLPGADFHDPASVLAALNRSFQMGNHNNMFFTIWYGVYNLPERRLAFASGGHPPALLLRGGSDAPPERLTSEGLLMGVMPEYPYESRETGVNPGDTLVLYSDGAFEITLNDGGLWTFEQFVETVRRRGGAIGPIHEDIKSLHGKPVFDDDFSMLQARFSE